jgi:hypothetical protein
VILKRLTPANKIAIWQPRWKDRKVLIAKFRVGTHNEVVFTKTKSLPSVYYLSGETIRRYPLENNGKILCHAVDMNELEILERE